MLDRRSPEIIYQSTQKRGAYQFSVVCESLDAHRWIERMEGVFVCLQVPEDRKVGLAMEFLEDEPLYWWTDICDEEPGKFSLGRIQEEGFCEVFRSDSSLSDSGRVCESSKGGGICQCWSFS